MAAKQNLANKLEEMKAENSQLKRELYDKGEEIQDLLVSHAEAMVKML